MFKVQHTVGIEPITEKLRKLLGPDQVGSTRAIVERTDGRLVKVCGTDADVPRGWTLEVIAAGVAQTYGAELVREDARPWRLDIREIGDRGREQILHSEGFTSRRVALVAFRAELGRHPAAYRTDEGRAARRRLVLLGPDRTPGVNR